MKVETDAVSCHFYIAVSYELAIISAELQKKTGFTLPKATEHFVIQIQECPTLGVKSFL